MTTSSTTAAGPRRPDQRPPVSGDARFRLVFTGNAFEAPPRIRHQRRKPRERSLRRTLRALVLWLLQPSPFTTRHR